MGNCSNCFRRGFTVSWIGTIKRATERLPTALGHLFQVLQIAAGKLVGVLTQPCLTLCDPMDCSPPGSTVQGISRQEYWSGLPLPSPGVLPDPGIEHTSPAFPALAGIFFTSVPTGKQWGKVHLTLFLTGNLLLLCFFCFTIFQ